MQQKSWLGRIIKIRNFTRVCPLVIADFFMPSQAPGYNFLLEAV